MNINNISKTELNDEDIFSLLNVKASINKRNAPVNKHKRKGSELRDKKRELGLAREELVRLKSERCPYSDPKGVMGGPAFQWRLEQENRIKRCEEKISSIKIDMTKLTQKQR